MTMVMNQIIMVMNQMTMVMLRRRKPYHLNVHNPQEKQRLIEIMPIWITRQYVEGVVPLG